MFWWLTIHVYHDSWDCPWWANKRIREYENIRVRVIPSSLQRQFSFANYKNMETNSIYMNTKNSFYASGFCLYVVVSLACLIICDCVCGFDCGCLRLKSMPCVLFLTSDCVLFWWLASCSDDTSTILWKMSPLHLSTNPASFHLRFAFHVS